MQLAPKQICLSAIRGQWRINIPYKRPDLDKSDQAPTKNKIFFPTRELTWWNNNPQKTHVLCYSYFSHKTILNPTKIKVNTRIHPEMATQAILEDEEQQNLNTITTWYNILPANP